MWRWTLVILLSFTGACSKEEVTTKPSTASPEIREVAKAEAQLREVTEKENEIAIAETSSRKLVGASVTPRTRSRTSLRLSHGIPNAANQSPGEFRSPGTELRRRAIAMGLRASPFAAKRKR